MDVSIIIVSYNSKRLIRECIKSIIDNTTNIKYEIIVIDNNSTDGTDNTIADGFSHFTFINNNTNKGFGAANNQGVKIANGKYLFFLNPDTLFVNNACEILYNYLENNKNIACAGGRLFTENFKDQISFCRFPSINQMIHEILLSSFFKNSTYSEMSSEGFLKDDSEIEVDSITGAAIFTRKTIIDEVGGFDENFFLFFEETDLCKRIREQGYTVKVNPMAKIIHLMGKTMDIPLQRFKWFEESRYYFLRKHYSFLFILISKSLYIFRYILLLIKHRNIEWYYKAKFIYKS